KGSGEGEGAAWQKLEILVVGGEEDEAGAVGDGEVHGHGVGGIEQSAVERGRDGQGPGLGGAARVPGAGSIAVKAQGGDGAAAGGAEGRGQGAVEGAIGGESGIALADAISKLAVVRQGQGTDGPRVLPCAARFRSKGGGEGEGAAGEELEIL